MSQKVASQTLAQLLFKRDAQSRCLADCRNAACAVAECES